MPQTTDCPNKQLSLTPCDEIVPLNSLSVLTVSQTVQINNFCLPPIIRLSIGTVSGFWYCLKVSIQAIFTYLLWWNCPLGQSQLSKAISDCLYKQLLLASHNAMKYYVFPFQKSPPSCMTHRDINVSGCILGPFPQGFLQWKAIDILLWLLWTQIWSQNCVNFWSKPRMSRTLFGMLKIRIFDFLGIQHSEPQAQCSFQVL